MPQQALQLTILDKLIEIIKGLGTSIGVDAKEVVAREMPKDWSMFGYRGISIIMDDTGESAGTNCRDDYGYRFLVVFCSGSSKGSNASIDRLLPQARNAVKKRFNNKRIVDDGSIPEVMICSVQDGRLRDPKAWQDGITASLLVVTVWTRESRT